MSSLFPPKPIPEDQSSLWSTVQALHWVQRVLAPLLLSRCAEPFHQRQPHLPLGTLAKSSSGADSPSPETPLAQSPAERSSPRVRGGTRQMALFWPLPSLSPLKGWAPAAATPSPARVYFLHTYCLPYCMPGPPPGRGPGWKQPHYAPLAPAAPLWAGGTNPIAFVSPLKTVQSASGTPGAEPWPLHGNGGGTNPQRSRKHLGWFLREGL